MGHAQFLVFYVTLHFFESIGSCVAFAVFPTFLTASMDLRERLALLARWVRRNDKVALVVVAAGAALVRLGLFLGLSAAAHISWTSVLEGHDGVEYLHVARAVANGSVAAVPHDVLRHDLGWPLLLAVFAPLLPVPFGALIFDLLFAVLTVFLMGSLARREFQLAPHEATRVAAATVLAYPAGLYYSCFALAEPLMLVAVLGAFFFAFRDRWVIAGFCAGIAAVTRAPGIFIVPALLAVGLMQSEHRASRLRNSAALLLSSSFVVVAMLAWRHWTFQAQAFTLHRPQFGLPFATFQGLFERGIARGIYLLACVCLAIYGTSKMVMLAWRRGAPLALRAAAIYSSLYLLFHLCLQSLVYYGQRIWLADYFDRYLLGIWPCVVLATWRWWRLRLILLMLVVGVALSLHWGTNYFQAVRERGAPLLEDLKTLPSVTGKVMPAKFE